MKKDILAPEKYYHIYCRGNNKSPIFFTEKDYYRLLANILLFQSPLQIENFRRVVDIFYKDGFDFIDKDLMIKISKERTVKLTAFTFMPNHFHLILKQLTENGITEYMRRILDGYTKYINIRHNRTGHVFQGRFGRVLVENNDQLLYLSTYIHRNCRELPHWKGKEEDYQWSSYQDYIKENRWGELLKPEIILEQFSSSKEFKKFTSSSIAKAKRELSQELLYPSFQK